MSLLVSLFLFFFGQNEQRDSRAASPGQLQSNPAASCSQITHISYGLKVLLQGRNAAFPGCLHSGLRWIHVLLCVRVCVCIQISAARSQAKPWRVFVSGRRVRNVSQKEFSQWGCRLVSLQHSVSARCKRQPLAWLTLAPAVMTAIGCGHTWRRSTGGPASSGSAHRCATGSLRRLRRVAFLTSPAQSCASGSL